MIPDLTNAPEVLRGNDAAADLPITKFDRWRAMLAEERGYEANFFKNDEISMTDAECDEVPALFDMIGRQPITGRVDAVDIFSMIYTMPIRSLEPGLLLMVEYIVAQLPNSELVQKLREILK